MDPDEECSTAPGELPEYGAIFMSSISTKTECLRRKIFGLPSSQAYFVEQVKAGMLLFLFEFEKRQLYGVFQALSDGAMNIVPQAYKTSGKQFPAQVPFSIVWDCSPLSEHEFRGAIKENYYTGTKFNFGLSKTQVYSLLRLFYSKRLENELQRELAVDCATQPDGDSLEKVLRKGNKFRSMGYSLKKEHDVEGDPESFFFAENSQIGSSKIRRMYDNGRSIECDGSRNEHSFSYVEDFRNFSEVRKSSGDGRLSGSDNNIQSGPNREEGNAGIVSSREYHGGYSFGARKPSDFTKICASDSQGNRRSLDNSCETDHWMQQRGSYAGTDNEGYDVGCRNAIRDVVQNKGYSDIDMGSVLTAINPQNSMDRFVRVAGDSGNFLSSGSVRFEHNLDNFDPNISTKYSRNSLGKESVISDNSCRYAFSYRNGDDGQKFATRENVEHGLDFDSGMVRSADCRGDSVCERRIYNDDMRFTSSGGLIEENSRANHFAPAFHNINTPRDSGNRDRVAAYEDPIYSTADQISAKSNVDISRGYADACWRDFDILAHPGRQIKEIGSTLVGDHLRPTVRPSKEPLITNDHFSTSYQDAVTTSTDPYNLEGSSICFKRSPSLRINHTSDVAEQCDLSYNSSNVNLYPSQALPRMEEQYVSTECRSGNDLYSSYSNHYFPSRLDSDGINLRERFGSSVSLPTTSPCEYALSDQGQLPSGSGYYQNKGIVPTFQDHDGHSFPDSAVPRAYTSGDISDANESIGGHTYSLGLEGGPIVADRDYSFPDNRFEHSLSQDVRESIMEEAPVLTESRCHLQSVSRSMHGIKVDINRSLSTHCISDPHSDVGSRPDHLKSRRSVFSRLTLVSRSRSNGNYFHRGDESMLDTSVDEVMDILDSNRNHWAKTAKSKPSIKHNGSVENLKSKKKQRSLHSQSVGKCLEMSPPKDKVDIIPADEVKNTEKAEETPVVNFKRRSQLHKLVQCMGKVQNEATVESHAENPGDSPNAQSKRRKLVRPNFF